VTADPGRLRAHVATLEGPRHRLAAPASLARAAEYVAAEFGRAGLTVEARPVRFAGGAFHNVVATLPGVRPERPRVLIGTHYDTMPGTPGADDNASGTAALLEAARLLARDAPEATVEFAGFTLEEPQGVVYGVGSRSFVQEAKRQGVRYAGALIVEMVGYTDARRGGQRVPAVLFWKRVPRTGNFLAAAGDGKSAALLREFAVAAQEVVPALELVTVCVPCRGWLVPHSRLSDNRSFWDAGYPALMLTDTAFLRNPNYHRAGDRLDTLDFGFMAAVTDALVAAVRRLAGPPVAGLATPPAAP
jgi:Zn-dependent M28 family amino/carboxypeptidase